MSEKLSVCGIVATTPRHIVTSEGVAITSFRLASSQRRYDRQLSRWVDMDTNWYTVTAFRQLALNSSVSLSKGDRVLATGRVRVRDWEHDGRSGTAVEIEADALGHDLSWGESRFEKNRMAPVEEEQPDADDQERDADTF